MKGRDQFVLLIFSSVVVVFEADAEEYHDPGNSPTDNDVLNSRKSSIFLDDVGNHEEHVKSLEHHEHEASRETPVNQDGYKLAESL